MNRLEQYLRANPDVAVPLEKPCRTGRFYLHELLPGERFIKDDEFWRRTELPLGETGCIRAEIDNYPSSGPGGLYVEVVSDSHVRKFDRVPINATSEEDDWSTEPW